MRSVLLQAKDMFSSVSRGYLLRRLGTKGTVAVTDKFRGDCLLLV